MANLYSLAPQTHLSLEENVLSDTFFQLKIPINLKLEEIRELMSGLQIAHLRNVLLHLVYKAVNESL